MLIDLKTVFSGSQYLFFNCHSIGFFYCFKITDNSGSKGIVLTELGVLVGETIF
ncbi:hypothetical protein BI355_0918 [Companilactobacillus crustorum]|nr:hypothetical protein BI355_0918 [Companilactobacillus crustorum]